MTKDSEKSAQIETAPCCEWKERYLALERRMSDMQKEMDDLKSMVNKNKSEVSSHCKHFYKEEVSVKEEVKTIRTKLEVLSNVVIRMEDKMNETSNKLTQMQARSMRKNVIISGIQEPLNESPEQLLTAVQEFISNQLKVEQEIPIKVCHRLNYVDNAEYRPVVVKLTTVEHKILLLSHGPQLKGQTNNRNRYFYINEQLPDKLAEDRRYAQQWIKENKAKPSNDQLSMKISRNRLRINNEPYNKKVKPPSAGEILRLERDDIMQTNQSPTVYGDSKLIEGSEFISYAVHVATVEQVRIAYRKLRMRYADATHISSAFRMDPPNGPLNQEGSDDGEYGAGRCLLGVLRDNNILNAAVFVIRFYGGKQIGAARFDAIKQLSTVALQKAGLLKPTKSGNVRRMTRSMSQRGRGSYSSVAAMAPPPTDLTSAFNPIPVNQQSMYRTTPANSPNVSPTHLFQHNSAVADTLHSDNDSSHKETTDEDDEDEQFEEIQSAPESLTSASRNRASDTNSNP